jgi:ComEC/Rec2-related protein
VFLRFVHRRLRRSWLVIAACLALFAGIFFARYQLLTDARIIWIIVPALAVSLKRHGVIALVLLSLLCFGVGWWRGSTYVARFAAEQPLYGQQVVLVGRANDDAVYGKRYQLEFTLRDVHVHTPTHQSFTGSLNIAGFGEPAIYRGDIVRVSGKLFPSLGNSVGRVSFAELTVLRRDNSWLNNLRRTFAAGMESTLPEPAASFALGLLIGQRSTLPDDTNQQLQHVGLTHIIAVSGANLTIIVLACRRLLGKLSKFQNIALCLSLIGVFLAITGSSPPIVRASVVSVLGLWAWAYGRKIKPLVLLLVGGAITVIANPPYLWGNVSWYLSFLSFFGVLILAPLLTRRIFGAKEPKILTSVLIESICATVLVVPYVLYIFGQVSTVSLIANLLVVPFVPAAMLLALVSGLAGMALPSLAGWLAWPATLLLTYIEHIGFSSQAMVVCYASILLVLAVLQIRVRNAQAAKVKNGSRHAYDSPKPPPQS